MHKERKTTRRKVKEDAFGGKWFPSRFPKNKKKRAHRAKALHQRIKVAQLSVSESSWERKTT